MLLLGCASYATRLSRRQRIRLARSATRWSADVATQVSPEIYAPSIFTDAG